MDSSQHPMLNTQLVDIGYLTPQLNMEDMPYQMPDHNLIIPSSNVKPESFDEAVIGFENTDLCASDRSMSYSSISSVSLSPQSHAAQPVPELPTLQISDQLYARHHAEISPATTAPSRKESDDEGYRAERRRAQNRAAQRAYRQRKDQSLKQREKEIETLRDELDKAQRLNKTLCKVVALLRERLKNPPVMEEADGI